MAKVRIKGIAAVERNIEQTFEKVRSSKQMRNDIGEFVVGRVQLEARRAKPLNDTRSLPDLKDSTKGIRKGLEKLNPTHPTYKANRSNLTFTGQLIDAVTWLIGKPGVIEIEVEDSLRTPIQTKSGPGDRESNKDVDADLRKRGFVMYTARGIRSEPKVLKRINNIVKKFIRRAIKVNFES